MSVAGISTGPELEGESIEDSDTVSDVPMTAEAMTNRLDAFERKLEGALDRIPRRYRVEGGKPSHNSRLMTNKVGEVLARVRAGKEKVQQGWETDPMSVFEEVNELNELAFATLTNFFVGVRKYYSKTEPKAMKMPKYVDRVAQEMMNGFFDEVQPLMLDSVVNTLGQKDGMTVITDKLGNLKQMHKEIRERLGLPPEETEHEALLVHEEDATTADPPALVKGSTHEYTGDDLLPVRDLDDGEGEIFDLPDAYIEELSPPEGLSEPAKEIDVVRVVESDEEADTVSDEDNDAVTSVRDDVAVEAGPDTVSAAVVSRSWQAFGMVIQNWSTNRCVGQLARPLVARMNECRSLIDAADGGQFSAEDFKAGFGPVIELIRRLGWMSAATGMSRHLRTAFEREVLSGLPEAYVPDQWTAVGDPVELYRTPVLNAALYVMNEVFRRDSSVFGNLELLNKACAVLNSGGDKIFEPIESLDFDNEPEARGMREYLTGLFPVKTELVTPGHLFDSRVRGAIRKGLGEVREGYPGWENEVSFVENAYQMLEEDVLPEFERPSMLCAVACVAEHVRDLAENGGSRYMQQTWWTYVIGVVEQLIIAIESIDPELCGDAIRAFRELNVNVSGASSRPLADQAIERQLVLSISNICNGVNAALGDDRRSMRLEDVADMVAENHGAAGQAVRLALTYHGSARRNFVTMMGRSPLSEEFAERMQAQLVAPLVDEEEAECSGMLTVPMEASSEGRSEEGGGASGEVAVQLVSDEAPTEEVLLVDIATFLPAETSDDSVARLQAEAERQKVAKKKPKKRGLFGRIKRSVAVLAAAAVAVVAVDTVVDSLTGEDADDGPTSSERATQDGGEEGRASVASAEVEEEDLPELGEGDFEELSSGVAAASVVDAFSSIWDTIEESSEEGVVSSGESGEERVASSEGGEDGLELAVAADLNLNTQPGHYGNIWSAASDVAEDGGISGTAAATHKILAHSSDVLEGAIDRMENNSVKFGQLRDMVASHGYWVPPSDISTFAELYEVEKTGVFSTVDVDTFLTQAGAGNLEQGEIDLIIQNFAERVR